ncbi:replicative helicase loader/inhibitor [Alkalicoccus chagannorensis]|uniref:replicative helicase loader/inhibitor n=1 Tax=Alkalicoccus chagannorensis TaxID=427072 RepID=UPI00047C5E38|nr:replicative helicase loader/inhibitor [Alkalicoccus chagannorensis]
MERKQAVAVIDTIMQLYPRAEFTEKKIEILIAALQKMDYKGVMKNLEAYVAEKPYPPTVAEIASYPPEPNEHFKKQQEWEREAAKVPQEKKEEFRRKMKQAIRQVNTHG